MFTGIIEETGTVRAVQPHAKGIRLVVESGAVLRGLKLGDSVAVNGCCLTAVALAGRGPRRRVTFDLLRETWDRTNLSGVTPGSLVNLERPLRAGARLDGHFVTGHIDGVGRITRWEASGKDYVLEVAAPADIRRYVVFKGSIAVDGISLTVAGLTPRGFRIWIIPHTRSVTALRERRVGDAVNLEADILGKYVEKFALRATPRRTARPARPTRRQ
ncbi:MAG: Riboflavin synthase [Verrucomicrobiota bacterium]|jgi:riboflavin synthase